MLSNLISPALFSLLLTLATVAVGAFFGGIARWALSHIPHPRAGTFTANIAACAVLGFSMALPIAWQIGLGAGFAGAMSTWSTLAKELGTLYKQRQWREFAKYAAATAAVGIVAFGMGMMWGRRGFGA